MSVATVLVVLATFFAWCIVPFNAQNCSIREVCDGQDSGVNVPGSTVDDLLSNARNIFCGCQYISKNVILSFAGKSNVPPLVEANLSFFHDIKEVNGYILLDTIPSIDQLSFPNLRIIRGMESHSGLPGISLAVGGKIQSLYLPLLTEISAGGVYLTDAGDSTALCNVVNGSSANGYGVHWDDILSDDDSMKVFDIIGCTGSARINCSQCDSGHCWCESDDASCCQTLTDTGCGTCTNRCFMDGSTFCCDSECSAGCFGGESNHCYACKNFNDEGNCVQSCESLKFIVDNNQNVIPNPAYRVSLDNQCLRSCPEEYVEFGGQCRTTCPDGFQSVDNVCEECDGLCDKVCDGRTVTDENSDINDLFECTIIKGNLQIDKLPVSWQPGDLNVLNSIRDIQGALYIEGWDELSFPYLSNLQYIGSNKLTAINSNVLSAVGCNFLTNNPIAVVIQGNQDLTSIDLSSLKEVHGGSVVMFNNPQLCYFGNFSTYFNDSSQFTCFGNQSHTESEQCAADGLVCATECDSSDGCWGPNDTQCVTCTVGLFRNDSQCIPDCSVIPGRYNSVSTRTCEPCHGSCDGTCFGAGATNCSNCSTHLRVKTDVDQGFECVESCPIEYYDGNEEECLPCFEGCIDCNGPQIIVNMTDGCTSCGRVILDNNLSQVMCLSSVSTCPRGYYPDQLMSSEGALEEGTEICLMCDEECTSCVGPGTGSSSCLECANFEDENGICVPECPVGSVADSSNRCQPLTASPSVVGGELMGTAALIGSVVGAVLLAMVLGVMAFFLTFFCCRRLSSKHSRVNFLNPMYGDLEMMAMEKETLQPPKVPPNAARLIVTPEDTLEFGKELGSGAFGTVYEGYWQPEGDINQYHVAIKVLKSTSAEASKELLQEGVVMASMDHENVVRLYSVCMSKQLMLISQFVPHGALIDYLKKNKDKLTASMMLQFAAQISQGMAYLETRRLVHRDLAARNVLVQSYKKVKITDFGLTRIIEAGEDHYEATSAKMPVRWLPPESIRTRKFTHKSDVWSFGVTTWEILTFGARPYQGKQPYDILRMLIGGHRLEQPVTCTIELYALLLECWLIDPDSRPTFDNLSDRLQEMLTDPRRYILTVQDDSNMNYQMLPDNLLGAGEGAYETPFLGESVQQGGQTVGMINPYGDLTSPKEVSGYEFATDVGDMDPDTAKLLLAKADYEVPVGSPNNSDQNPRYVQMSIGVTSPAKKPEPNLYQQSPVTNEGPHNYDSISEKELDNDEKQYMDMSYDMDKKPPLADSNYELPCDPNTLGSQLVETTPASHYETPTDAVIHHINNGIVPAVEANYELPCNSDTLGSPLPSVSPYEVPSDTAISPAVEDNYEMPTNPDALGSPLIAETSPYEVPVDSHQSKFPFHREVQTLPASANGPAGKGMFDKPFTSNTLSAMPLADHNYEEPDFPEDHNYELPTDGIENSNYETLDDPPQQNDNYDTVADDMDDMAHPPINIYDAPCS